MTAPTILLPINTTRTTAQDVAAIAWQLATHDSSIQFLPFPRKTPPDALFCPLPAQTATFTLNSYRGADFFETVPGPKFFPPRLTKAEIAQTVIAAGIPVPHTATFDPDTAPDPAIFGPVITIKSMAPGTSRAQGIYVFRTAEFAVVRDQLVSLYQDDVAAGFPPLLQQFITTGDAPVSTRVTLFLGAPIICFDNIAPAAFSAASITGLAGGEATANAHDNRTMMLTNDEEMITLAKQISGIFPKACVISADLVRCADTGTVYCVEASMGNLCLLSAPLCSGVRDALGAEKLHQQFGSYDTIARRMIDTLRLI